MHEGGAPHRRSWLNKINYIARFLVNPCSAPAIVYLELAAAPAGDAIITWFDFGVLDIIRGAVRPNAANRKRPRRGKGNKGKGKSGGRLKFAGAAGAWKRMPGLGDDVGGWMGKNLPGAKQFKGHKTSAAERFLWRIDDLGQRALFGIMVVGIGTDFLYDWFSLLDDSLYCQQTDGGGLVAIGSGTNSGGILICNAGLADDVIWKEGDCNWIVSIGSVGDGNWTLISSMKLKCTSAGPCQHAQKIIIGAETFWSPVQTIQPGDLFDSILTLDIDGPASFVLNHCTFPGAVQPEGADAHSVSIFGISSFEF